jgi:hypothetical protein
MALPKYRIIGHDSRVGGVIYTHGTEVEFPLSEPPRESWAPLNDEAREQFKKYGRTPKPKGELHGGHVSNEDRAVAQRKFDAGPAADPAEDGE